jgi:enoyl-[acyl-carrier protein] reductase II
MGTVMAGQIAGMIKKEQTCAEIIQEIVQEAKETIKKCSIFAEDSCGNEAEHV